MKEKNQWASKLGFLLATAGSAIGLGNLWKFPYLMGKNGGFFFLIAYLVFVCLLGLPIMMTEMSIGRKFQQNPVHAYEKIHPKAKAVGVVGVLAAFFILSYYSVIGGWIVKYFAQYAVTLQAPADFGGFISNGWEPVLWHLLFMGATATICVFGVRGIEKSSKVMMPGLFLLLLAIILPSLTLPNAGEGLAFMFTPSQEGFSLRSISAALGQVFYSLSLCMGITITYGRYLSKEGNIPRSCLTVAGLDTMMAVLSGLAIFPAVFSFGLAPDNGPSLVFNTLPKVFEQLQGGVLFALLFFLLVFFAAVTSALALLEVCVSFAIDKWGWGRRKATLLVAGAAFVLGIPSALSYGMLSGVNLLNYDLFDFVCMVTDNLLLPVGGVLMCWFVGWKWKPQLLAEEMEEGGARFRLKKAWLFCIRFITPILVVMVTLTGFVSVFQRVTGQG